MESVADVRWKEKGSRLKEKENRMQEEESEIPTQLFRFGPVEKNVLNDANTVRSHAKISVLAAYFTPLD